MNGPGWTSVDMNKKNVHRGPWLGYKLKKEAHQNPVLLGGRQYYEHKKGLKVDTHMPCNCLALGGVGGRRRGPWREAGFPGGRRGGVGKPKWRWVKLPRGEKFGIN